VKLSNDTGSSLPPGLLTLYERGSKGHISYVGDARLGWFPSGENRVVSFAVDLKTQVVVDRSSAQRTATGRISRGVLQLDVFDQQTTRYTIRAPANEVRTVLIETPRLSGWTLAAPTGRDVEQTQDAYRLRMRVAPNETKDVTVVQERPIATSFALVDANYDTLLLYAKNTVLSSGVRSALENAAALRRGVDKEQEGLTELESRRTRIVTEQERIRQNLARVPAGNDLHKRFLDTLRQQEDDLQALAEQIKEAEGKVSIARRRLSDAIEKMDL
jgi:hypothetical protein